MRTGSSAMHFRGAHPIACTCHQNVFLPLEQRAEHTCIHIYVHMWYPTHTRARSFVQYMIAVIFAQCERTHTFPVASSGEAGCALMMRARHVNPPSNDVRRRPRAYACRTLGISVIWAIFHIADHYCGNSSRIQLHFICATRNTIPTNFNFITFGRRPAPHTRRARRNRILRGRQLINAYSDVFVEYRIARAGRALGN